MTDSKDGNLKKMCIRTFNKTGKGNKHDMLKECQEVKE